MQPPLSFERCLGLMVLIGALAIFVWGIWAIPVLSHNEARRMVVVQEMVRDREWLLPFKNGDLPGKAPLFYWIASFFSLVTQSTAEWVLRLPSALSGLARLVVLL